MANLAKKRKFDQENRQFKDEFTDNFLFILTDPGHKPMCLLCNETVAIVKSANMKRHFMTKHQNFNTKFEQFAKDKD